MARLAALEQNDFAPIRSLLSANYGEAAARANITPVENGSQSVSYKINVNGNAFYFKIAKAREGKKVGLPEQFAQYLYSQNIPAIHFEKMKDGRIVKELPTDFAALKQLVPNLSDDKETIDALSGAALSLSPTMQGTPIPSKLVDPDGFSYLISSTSESVGMLAGQIASKTNDFLSSHHLTLNDAPPSKYANLEKTADMLLHTLHLDAFGSFDEVHHQLHDKNSPASQHLHHHAEIMRKNAAMMDKVASTSPNADVLRNNANILREFAYHYENGFALESMHYMNQALKLKPRLMARETSLTHGDFWHDNLLTQNGKLSGVVDFDRLQKGDKLQDVVNFLGMHDFNPHMIQTALKGFEKGFGSKLTKEDLAIIPYLKLQHEIMQIPLDLKLGFQSGFPKGEELGFMTRELTEEDIRNSTIKPMNSSNPIGRLDSLKPYIHSDYTKIYSEPQFDTSLFRKAGRIHAERGAAIFDYIGAVFSLHDFEAPNAARLEEKINTVIDIEERLKLFTAANPSRKEYTIDEVVQAYPNINIPDDVRANRRNALAAEIKTKLDTFPKGFNIAEDQMERQLASLPADIQKWLYLKGTEFTFTAATVKDDNGREYYKGNEGMFPNHPSVAHMRKGGGNFLTYRPNDKNAITYAYTSMQRNPMVLLAHEAIGHSLYNEARQRDPSVAHIITNQAAQAAMADIGDINKTKAANPTPNNGRLGALKQAVDTSQDDESLWNALQKIGGELPALQGDARAQWLKDVRALTQDTFKKLGPDGWMHNVKMYADRNLFLDEIIAATAEQMFVTGKGKESAMNFVLPALTGFFNAKLLGEMKQFIAEKEDTPAPPALSQETLQASEIEAKLREETMRRELLEESQRLNNFSSIARGIGFIALAGAGIAAISITWPIAIGCAALSGLGFFGANKLEKYSIKALQKAPVQNKIERDFNTTTNDSMPEKANTRFQDQEVSKAAIQLEQRAV